MHIQYVIVFSYDIGLGEELAICIARYYDSILIYRFKFPSVFVVYEMFPLGLFEVFLLIAFTDRERLLCSKRDVVGSLQDSTPFCNIQGVFIYSEITIP